jgi:hypothetical protein
MPSVGISPFCIFGKPERRPIMAVLQADLDESGKKSDHPLIAISVVCAPTAGIEKFTDDWNGLLRINNLSDFHMVRAAQFYRAWGIHPKQTLEERTEAIGPFGDCLNENLELGLIQAWDVKGFGQLPEEIIHKLLNTKIRITSLLFARFWHSSVMPNAPTMY